MRDRLQEFGDADVVLVMFTDPENVPEYRERHGAGLPVVIDADRSAYRAFGLGRGSIGRVWGLRAAATYARLLRRGGLGRLARPTEDTLQLGGDFIVDPDGRLVYGYWGAGPDDRPEVEELLDALTASRTSAAD